MSSSECDPEIFANVQLPQDPECRQSFAETLAQLDSSLAEEFKRIERTDPGKLGTVDSKVVYVTRMAEVNGKRDFISDLLKRLIEPTTQD